MAGVFIFVAVVIGVIAVFAALNAAKQADEAWRHAAQKLGLRCEIAGAFKPRKIEGRMDGCRVHIDTYTQSTGKSSTTYTRFRVEFPQSLPSGLKLTRQGFFSGVATFFGAQDIEVGDKDFDDAVMVKGPHEKQVRDFLTPARRVRIQRLLRTRDGAEIDSTRITWSKRGVIRTSQELVLTARSLVATAKSLAAPPEEDAPLERALAARAEGDLDGALGHLSAARRERALGRMPPPLPAADDGGDAGAREVPVPTPTPERGPEAIEETLMEGEILYLEGRREEAKQVFDEARETLPADPDIDAWAAEVAKPPEEAGSAPAQAADAPAALDVDSVCRALFVDVTSSLDASRVFEARYQDRDIEWEGTLKSAQPFSFDFVLGSDGGTKALVEVFELPSVSIGGTRVTAVVGLPKGEDRPLGEHVGHAVRVRGRLVRVDSFMRNVFVRDATWEAV